MLKTRRYGLSMLIAFFGILALPLFSAPAEPLADKDKANMLFFEDADEHTNQWLIRSVSEGEEFSSRSETSQEQIVLFDCFESYHTSINKIKFQQTIDRSNIRLPKDRLYIFNSVLTI